ncbi:SLC13 family permease [Thermochromatium tepidum]|uniref:SLC13 family permease n=1 Tax=Thermochromatium tepidum TaxID=1050 RepID=UPI001FE73BB8|nr:SLC13 family permease [Thermochromatium tepidum]
MTALIVLVFLLVYLGLFLGGLPSLQLDRTGVALLGAILLLATDVIEMDQVWQAIHLPTLALLFAFMVISAQLRLSGFYDWVVWRLDRSALPPVFLLGAVILASALLSAVFSNDIVCLAMAPVLADTCRARRLAPVPFLLALACAANLGSAATLIGNPQNMLIGERLGLDFGGYLVQAIAPVGLGLAVTWLILLGLSRRRWHLAAPVAANPELDSEATSHRQRAEDQAPGLDRWQTVKGLGVTGILLCAFLFAPWPRDLLALAGAGLR